MFIKLATYALVGSVTVLTVAGVANLDERDWGSAHGSRVRVEIGEHVRDDVRSEVRRRHERRRHERRVGHNSEVQLEGTYAFDANGNPMGKLPWSAHVELDLQPEGRYELRVKMDVNGEGESEYSWGRYRQEGDRLVLYSPSDNDQTEFVIEGDRLLFEGDWTENLALKAVGITNAALSKVTAKE